MFKSEFESIKRGQSEGRAVEEEWKEQMTKEREKKEMTPEEWRNLMSERRNSIRESVERGEMTKEDEKSLSLLIKKIEKAVEEQPGGNLGRDPLSIIAENAWNEPKSKEELRDFNVMISNLYPGARLAMKNPGKYKLSQEEKMAINGIITTAQAMEKAAEERMAQRNKAA